MKSLTDTFLSANMQRNTSFDWPVRVGWCKSDNNGIRKYAFAIFVEFQRQLIGSHSLQ